MIDIVGYQDGKDLHVANSDAPRAANILSVQVDSLEYASELGIDLKYFLDETVEFQNQSFRAYLVQRLAQFGINVATVEETVSNLFTTLGFNLEGSSESDGMVAR